MAKVRAGENGWLLSPKHKYPRLFESDPGYRPHPQEDEDLIETRSNY